MISTPNTPAALAEKTKRLRAYRAEQEAARTDFEGRLRALNDARLDGQPVNEAELASVRDKLRETRDELDALLGDVAAPGALPRAEAALLAACEAEFAARLAALESDAEAARQPEREALLEAGRCIVALGAALARLAPMGQRAFTHAEGGAGLRDILSSASEKIPEIGRAQNVSGTSQFPAFVGSRDTTKIHLAAQGISRLRDGGALAIAAEFGVELVAEPPPARTLPVQRTVPEHEKNPYGRFGPPPPKKDRGRVGAPQD